MIRLLPIIFLCSHFITELLAQNNSGSVSFPKQEVRAVWIATVNALDWPHSVDPIEQKRTLKEMIVKLKAANFNTIYFQVRSRGDAMYRSGFEPWAQQLTGSLGKDPGWDPLSFVIEEAHVLCMEVHPWFNTYVVWTKKDLPPHTKPLHLLHEHPDWIHSVNGEWWLDPGIPEVREYLLKVALDIVRRYDADGIHFDFIRYPGRPFPDDEAYRRYGGGMKKDDWRRENVNLFVKAFHDSAGMIKPMLKIGATPIGIYKNSKDAKGQQSYSELFQDSRRWLREGWMDYIVPQVYWTLGSSPGDPDFGIVVKDWANNSYDRQIIIGIGSYKPEVLDEMPTLIDTVRAAHLQGVSFFRYESIARSLDPGGRFRYAANIPPMSWKDAVLPNPPENFQVKNITDGIFQIAWSPPFLASDRDGAEHYTIYRSIIQPIDIQNPANILAVLPGMTNQFIDTIKHVASAKYYYAVSTLDKSNNESTPAFESVVIPEIVDLAKRFNYNFRLGQNYPNPASSFVSFPYEVKEKSPVILKIIDRYNREVMGVVDAVQEQGRYVASADISRLEDGIYSCLFVAGNFSQKIFFTVDN